MKDVMSIRLDPQARRHLRDLAARRKKDLSTVARELIDYGWVFLMLQEYRQGKLSLGSFARALGVPLSEAIDLLADLGVRSPIEYDDYLAGYAVASDFFRGHKP